VTLDPTRLPETCKYLASLPQGLESFPRCTVRDVSVDAYVRDFSGLAAEPGLPGPVADMLRGSLKGAWLSETVFQVANLVVRDLAFANDASFSEWIFDANTELFDKPFLRNLMRLLSPMLIVIGASKRWGTFHQGSDLASGRVARSGDREETLATLRYPAGVFAPLFLTSLEQVFLAALVASRAKDPRVELGAVGAAEAEYKVSWRA
jgi:hypothetical protein